jgi:hypothetical protein
MLFSSANVATDVDLDPKYLTISAIFLNTPYLERAKQATTIHNSN